METRAWRNKVKTGCSSPFTQSPKVLSTGCAPFCFVLFFVCLLFVSFCFLRSRSVFYRLVLCHVETLHHFPTYFRFTLLFNETLTSKRPGCLMHHRFKAELLFNFSHAANQPSKAIRELVNERINYSVQYASRINQSVTKPTSQAVNGIKYK